MRMLVRSCLVLALVLLPCLGRAQQPPPPNKTQAQPDRMDIAVMFNGTHTNLTSGPGFWMEGGSVEAAGAFFHGLGAVAQLTATHAIAISNQTVGLTLFTFDAGPRYTWRVPSAPKNKHPMDLFGQALIGVTHGSDSAFPTGTTVSSSASSFAFQAGGGWDVKVAHRIGWRVAEADWLHTQLPNGGTNAQNHFMLSSGVVVRF